MSAVDCGVQEVPQEGLAGVLDTEIFLTGAGSS
jgi:hypothetical protein